MTLKNIFSVIITFQIYHIYINIIVLMYSLHIGKDRYIDRYIYIDLLTIQVIIVLYLYIMTTI